MIGIDFPFIKDCGLLRVWFRLHCIKHIPITSSISSGISYWSSSSSVPIPTYCWELFLSNGVARLSANDLLPLWYLKKQIAIQVLYLYNDPAVTMKCRIAIQVLYLYIDPAVTMKCRIAIQVLYLYIDPAVTMKCRIAIQVLFLYIDLCLSVKLTSLSRSFTSISFLTTSCSFTLICV